MSKKKTKKKIRSTPSRLTADQSIMFINAIFSYSMKNELSMDALAKASGIPLGIIQKWFDPATPFSGRIETIYRDKFCSSMHVGRDELPSYAASNPFFHQVDIDTKDIQSGNYPEYMRPEIESRIDELDYFDEDEELPIFDDVVDKIETVNMAETNAVETIKSAEINAAEKPHSQAEVEPQTKTENETALSSLYAIETTPLSPFEHAIVTLIREHDAATMNHHAVSPVMFDSQIAEAKQLTTENAELSNALENANEQLQENETALKENDAAIAELNRQIKDLRNSIHKKDAEIKRLRPYAKKATDIDATTKRYKEFIEVDPLFTTRNLTTADVYAIASRLWQSRLIFTKTAQKDIRGYDGDAYELLSALRALAVPFYDHVFGDENALMEDDIKKVCGFEIALHETQRTAENKRCRQERTVSYNGRNVFFEKHLKAGHGATNLRIHFEIDKDANCIVIGRCGSHLTTVRDF